MYTGKNSETKRRAEGKRPEESGLHIIRLCQRRDLEKLGWGIGRFEDQIGRVIYLPWPLLTKLIVTHNRGLLDTGGESRCGAKLSAIISRLRQCHRDVGFLAKEIWYQARRRFGGRESHRGQLPCGPSLAWAVDPEVLDLVGQNNTRLSTRLLQRKPSTAHRESRVRAWSSERSGQATLYDDGGGKLLIEAVEKLPGTPNVGGLNLSPHLEKAFARSTQ